MRVRFTEENWSGAKERYFLDGNNGRTILTVELDPTGEFDDYFKATFPAALEPVKQILEGAYN